MELSLCSTHNCFFLSSMHFVLILAWAHDFWKRYVNHSHLPNTPLLSFMHHQLPFPILILVSSFQTLDPFIINGFHFSSSHHGTRISSLVKIIFFMLFSYPGYHIMIILYFYGQKPKSGDINLHVCLLVVTVYHHMYDVGLEIHMKQAP